MSEQLSRQTSWLSGKKTLSGGCANLNFEAGLATFAKALAVLRPARQTGSWALMVHCNQSLALLDAMPRGRMPRGLTKQRTYIAVEMKLSFI